ncbi:MAG: 7-cyano-7-deazaguanine/7-aminomethyl-7-deazaguanine transporter [Arsenophonus sp. NEOnobi-MAG3]
MFELTQQQRIKALIWLSFFHILIITSSNYLLQFPIAIFGFHTTWGAFTFPFIFLTTDLTVRIYGASLARRIIAAAMLPAFSVSYILSALFYQGEWQGFITLNEFNLFVTRIALASFMAYALGQIMDIFVLNKLRNYRPWWISPTAAMFLGNLLDTITFFFIAFYHSTDSFMAINWVEIGLVDYSFKLFIYLLFLLPAYGGMLNFIQSYFFQANGEKNY